MKSLVRAFALLLFYPALSLAQVAYDASCSVGGASAASLSCNLTVAGSDRLVHVGTSFYQNSDTSVSSATYNSVATTAVPSGQTNNGSYYVHARTLVAPATGTNACQVNYGGNAGFDLGLVCTSFTGVDQSTPIGTAVTATGTSTTPSATVTTSADEFIVDQLVIVHSGTLSVGASQTSRANATANGFVKYAASTQDGADGGVMSWSNSTSQAWATVATPIKAVAAAAPSARNLSLLGVGP